MPRTLVVSGQKIAAWKGVRVFQRQDDNQFHDITNTFSWSDDVHQHYEVKAIGASGGSYWVPVSTHPPSAWGGSTLVTGTSPQGKQPVNPAGTEYRPTGTYIWIPDASIPGNLTPGITTNSVECTPPTSYPPVKTQTHFDILREVLGDPPATQSAFQDSDGLISFVNLSSSFVQDSPQFTTGREVCDKVANFFSTMRLKIFTYLQQNPSKVLAGDAVPTTQWDASVTHYIQYLLVQAGGFADFQITTETYSVTEVITEFNTAIIKLMFDAVTAPENILTDVMDFISSVGTTLRASWDDRSRSFSTCLLGQCHEAVQTDSSGQNFIYFPKVKYYYISVDSSQQEFTSPCTSVNKITFNFKYDYYVTALKASVLDNTTTDYANFVKFLDYAQGISYQDATNNLNAILNGVTSSSPQSPELEANPFGVNLMEYPSITVPRQRIIQQILNGELAA